MATTTAAEVTPEKIAEYEATLNKYLSGLEKMQIEIADNRRDIEMNRAETESMLKNTLAVLNVA